MKSQISNDKSIEELNVNLKQALENLKILSDEKKREKCQDQRASGTD